MAAVTEPARKPVATATRTWRVGLGTVLVVATALRLAYLAELRATPWFAELVVDPEYYDAWARRIAGGDWLGTGPFYMDPLYPYLLGALYAVAGRDLLLARLVNVVCSVGACAATAALGRRVGGPGVGLLAGAGLALYEPDVFATGELDKTALSMLLVALVLLLATHERRPARFATGLVLGLAALTRANLLVFVPLGALALAASRERPEAAPPRSDAAAAGRRGGGRARRRAAADHPRHAPADRRRRAAGAALFLAGVVTALAPVTLRNRFVTGEWVLTTTQLGQNFYTGNNPENPYGAYGVVSFVRANPHFEEADFRAAAEARIGRRLDAREASWFWLRAGLAHVAAEPAFALRAFARKAALVWNDFEISDSQDQYLLERDARTLRLPLLGFGEVAGFAVLGLVAGRRRRPVRLLGAFVVLYGATLVLFFVFARYRIQVVPALLPLAALGVTTLAARLRAGDLRAAAGAAAVVGLAAAASFHPIGLFSPDHPIVVEMRLRRYADAYDTAGDTDRAIAALQEAVPGCTHGCPWALADLFALYRRSGRTAEGVRYFERVVREHPGQRDAPGYLATLRGSAPATP